MRMQYYKKIAAGQLQFPITGLVDFGKERSELLRYISLLEDQIREVKEDLIHDSLTKLKTRAFFEGEARNYISSITNKSKNKRKEYFGFENISILFFDIDHFKRVNDTYGHDVGDLVLCGVAKNISNSLRCGDIVARWGGEEIVAMLLGSGEDDARIKAEEIRKKIEMMFFVNYPELKITISIGVVHTNVPVTYEQMIKRADDALYEAKRTGRNKVAIY